jgi:hypothetical protein
MRQKTFLFQILKHHDGQLQLEYIITYKFMRSTKSPWNGTETVDQKPEPNLP